MDTHDGWYYVLLGGDMLYDLLGLVDCLRELRMKNMSGKGL